MKKANVNINLNIGESVEIHLNSVVDIRIERDVNGYDVHTIACGKDCKVSVSYDELSNFIDNIFPNDVFSCLYK